MYIITDRPVSYVLLQKFYNYKLQLQTLLGVHIIFHKHLYQLFCFETL